MIRERECVAWREGKKLFMSCFIFNLIATVDKAQIQTFSHIKKRRRSFRCWGSYDGGWGKSGKLHRFFSSSLHLKILLRYCDTNWTSTYLICETSSSRLNNLSVFGWGWKVCGESLWIFKRSPSFNYITLNPSRIFLAQLLSLCLLFKLNDFRNAKTFSDFQATKSVKHWKWNIDNFALFGCFVEASFSHLASARPRVSRESSFLRCFVDTQQLDSRLCQWWKKH
jgi:hypothetical protein